MTDPDHFPPAKSSNPGFGAGGPKNPIFLLRREIVML
jgi:hypothetical protein